VSPTNWREVKSKARAVDPGRDSPDRVARRAAMRQQMLTAVTGSEDQLTKNRDGAGVSPGFSLTDHGE
jgi:hypothetical protein